MSYEKLIETIYAEKDIGRGIATTVAGVTGLVAYHFTSNGVISAFWAVTVYPLARLLASLVHSRLKARNSESRYRIATELNRFSDQELLILEFFVRMGGCCVSWGSVNRSEFPFPRPALNSLRERGLIKNGVMEDGMTESFILDCETFDMAQKFFQKKLANEAAKKMADEEAAPEF